MPNCKRTTLKVYKNMANKFLAIGFYNFGNREEIRAGYFCVGSAFVGLHSSDMKCVATSICVCAIKGV